MKAPAGTFVVSRHNFLFWWYERIQRTVELVLDLWPSTIAVGKATKLDKECGQRLSAMRVDAGYRTAAHVVDGLFASFAFFGLFYVAAGGAGVVERLALANAT